MTETYPDVPGWREHETSKAAAEVAELSAKTIRDRIKGILGYDSVSVHEAAQILQLPVSSVQPRFSELRAAGEIEPTGERFLNSSGVKAHIWRLRV